jgi:quinol monooxygenase YgiN
MLVLHAFIKVKPEFREEFLNSARQAMAGSKAEEGCNSYHLYEDAVEPNSFIMVEEWKDAAALEFHFNTEHFKAHRAHTEGMYVEPTRLVRYEVSSKQ